MYGYVYLTTCIPTGKKYIGMHKYEKEEIDTRYFGSGRLIAKSLKKYGKSQFICEVLEFCNTKDELVLKEQYYINKYNAVADDNFYNIDDGRGNSHEYSCEESTKKKLSEKQTGHKTIHKGTEVKVVYQNELQDYLDSGWTLGRNKRDYSARINKFKETHYSEEYKDKLQSWKDNIRNSIKGRRWVNNGENEMQVNQEDIPKYIEQGYVFGRLFARGKI